MYKSIFNKVEIMRYIYSYNLFTFGNSLAGSFINILFLNTGTIENVFTYQVSFQASQMLFFLLSGITSSRVEEKGIYSLGLILRAASLMAALFIGGIFFNNIFFGVTYGMSGGLFWAGNAIVSMNVSKGSDRMSFVSLNSFASNISSLIAPIIGGVVIELTPLTGIYRYSIVFSFTTFLLLSAVVEVMRIKASGPKHGKMYISDSFTIGKSVKSPFKSFFFFSSTYMFALLILLPIYVYTLTHNYTIVGIMVAVMALANALGNALSPYLIKKSKNTRRPYLYSTLIIVSSIGFVIARSGDIIAPFVSGFIAFLFFSPINNRAISNFMNSLDNELTSFPQWIYREYFLFSGRLFTLIFLLIFSFIMGFSNTIILLSFLSISVIFTIPAATMG